MNARKSVDESSGVGRCQEGLGAIEPGFSVEEGERSAVTRDRAVIDWELDQRDALVLMNDSDRFATFHCHGRVTAPLGLVNSLG
jgi:hypothetical protein